MKTSGAMNPKAFNNSLSTREFGVIGDGVTDDTEALQNAINSGVPSITVDGNVQITSTMVLANGQSFPYRPGLQSCGPGRRVVP